MDQLGKGEKGGALYRYQGNIKSSTLRAEIDFSIIIDKQLPMIGMRPELVEKFIKLSLAALKLDYLDLYLVHTTIGLIGQHDKDIFPHNPDGTVALDMTTDLVKVWEVKPYGLIIDVVRYYDAIFM